LRGLNLNNMTNNPRKVILEVREWAKRQPWQGVSDADYGVVEEVGEKVHCILKNIQGIRGFNDEAFFKEHLKDAFGDAMVYLSDWCGQRNTYYHLPTGERTVTFRAYRPLLAKLLAALAQLVAISCTPPEDADPEECKVIASKVAQTLDVMALNFGFNLLEDCLYPTWDKVKQRDWAKNPHAPKE